MPCDKCSTCSTDFTNYNFNSKQRAQNTVLKKAVIEEQEKTKTLQVSKNHNYLFYLNNLSIFFAQCCFGTVK